MDMDKVDRILLDWHTFELGWQPVAGFEREDSSCSMFRSSRQWMTLDELNAEVDWIVIEQIARAVDPFVLALDMRSRLAVNTAVRNLYAGAIVWINPRYPDTQDADYAQAKRILAPKFLMRGLMTREDWNDVQVTMPQRRHG